MAYIKREKIAPTIANEYTVIKTLFNAAGAKPSSIDSMIDTKVMPKITSVTKIHGFNNTAPHTSNTPTTANAMAKSKLNAALMNNIFTAVKSFDPLSFVFLLELFFIGFYPLRIIFQDQDLPEPSVPFLWSFQLESPSFERLPVPWACGSYLRGPAAS